LDLARTGNELDVLNFETDLEISKHGPAAFEKYHVVGLGNSEPLPI
jgi:hypothetical protein